VRRRRGRPPLSHYPNERVDVRIPEPLYDAACREAVKRDISLPALIRIGLARLLTLQNQPTPSPHVH